MKVRYFKNDTCGVCKAFLPRIQRISQDYNLELEIIDVTKSPEIAGQNMVFTVPTVLITDKNGSEMKRFARNFSELEIRDFIERILSILNQ